jgi:hypothetical protein
LVPPHCLGITPQVYESALKRLIGAIDSVKEGEPIEHVTIRPEA